MDKEIIKEKYLENYPIPITAEKTEIILSQMRKCICKIYMDNGDKGTGFFCKIPYENEENKYLLITNNHIIGSDNLGKNKKIDLSIDNDRIKKKLIIGNRKVYTSKLYDTTIIEIYKEKDNIKDFLDIDFDINSEIFNNMYINKTAYILQYPNNEKVSVSYGIIKNINLSNNYEIIHLCSTEKGSSGAPILNISTNKIFGIHTGAYEKTNYNLGNLLIYPLKEFISKIKGNKNPKHKKVTLKNSIKNVICKPTRTGDIREKTLKKIMIDNRQNNQKDEGYQIFGLIDDSLYGVIAGPPNTFYEDGFFQFMVVFPNSKDFLTKPPSFYFQTKIFHPNVDEFGLLSLDIFKQDWNPEDITFGNIIIYVQSLLNEPNPDNFVNENAAQLYKENIKEYEIMVRQLTSEFANFEIVQNNLKKINFQMELDE